MVALALLWSWVFWLALASTLSGASVEGGKAPVLFWASYPVLPNETVVLAGLLVETVILMFELCPSRHRQPR